jgi:hypothetical protein
VTEILFELDQTLVSDNLFELDQAFVSGILSELESLIELEYIPDELKRLLGKIIPVEPNDLELDNFPVDVNSTDAVKAEVGQTTN